MPQGIGTYGTKVGRPKKKKSKKFKRALKGLRKRLKRGRNGDEYGQIPTRDGTENPVGGN